MTQEFREPILEDLFATGFSMGEKAREQVVRHRACFGLPQSKGMNGWGLPCFPGQGESRGGGRHRRGERRVGRKTSPEGIPTHPTKDPARVTQGGQIGMGLDHPNHSFLTPTRQAPHHRPRRICHGPAVLANQASRRELAKVFRADDRADTPLGIGSLFGHAAKLQGCQGLD